MSTFLIVTASVFISTITFVFFRPKSELSAFANRFYFSFFITSTFSRPCMGLRLVKFLQPIAGVTNIRNLYLSWKPYRGPPFLLFHYPYRHTEQSRYLPFHTCQEGTTNEFLVTRLITRLITRLLGDASTFDKIDARTTEN